MTAYSRLRIAASLVLMLAITAACGFKTAPIIPPSPRPESVKDIKAETRGATAYLSWPIPARNVEGKSIKPADIVRFRIYRAELGRSKRMGRYRQYAEIKMSNPGPATVANGIVTWSDEHLKYGQTYGYLIRAVSARGGISPQSEEIRLLPLLPLDIPHGVVGVGLDGYVDLTWAPVTTWLDGEPATGFIGYNVYRGTDRGRHDETPLNKEPLRDAAYKDSAVLNNHTYYYIVRSVANPVAPWNESPDSAETSATPKNLMPPHRPTGLTVVPGVNRVFLTWIDNKEADLAGYYVYRSTGSSEPYKRLTDKIIDQTTFSDDTVKGGVTYYYVVTALNQAGSESEPSVRLKARVEKISEHPRVPSIVKPAIPRNATPGSAETSTIPGNLTPPHRPTGLTVVPGVNRVFLTWNENKEADLAGYYVYRSTGSTKKYKRLTSKIIDHATYSDETVENDVTYYYFVTAVNQAGKESKPSVREKVYVEKFSLHNR